jgi:DNA-binding protein Fis
MPDYDPASSRWIERSTLKQAEDFLVEEALRRCNNNQSHAARLLRMTPSALN